MLGIIVYDAPQGHSLELNVLDLEQRLRNLQWQVERLWQMVEGNVQPDQSLTGTADQYAENLKRLGITAERHARAVGQLESYVSEWKDANSHIQQRFDRADTRLASFESDVQRRLSEFGRDLESAIAELRTWSQHQPARLDSAAPSSLDDVTRLHTQPRDSQVTIRPAGDAGPSLDQPGVLSLRAFPPAGQTIPDPPPPREQPISWRWRAAVSGLGLAAIAAGGFGWHLQNEMQAAAGRAQQAGIESQRAAADAARQAAAAREEADRQISSARDMANRAERIGKVLAAPDLIRYSLSGGPAAPAASGQALWSRTRGFVFSGSRIPPPPPQGTHQLWLLTRFAPVKASTFVPEPDGTVTIVEQGLNVPRAVVGIVVTAEAAGGGDGPSGEPILTSALPVQ